MALTYPHVLGERETLDLVLQGHSLARFGDGEFVIAEGRSNITQPAHPVLADRLRGILQGAGHPCLVGIPNLQSPMPRHKARHWEKYRKCASLLSPTQVYVSAFVSRPDSAPGMDTLETWSAIESLWHGLDIVLVRGRAPIPQADRPDRLTGAVSLIASDLTTARSVREVVGPSTDAWAVYPQLLEEIDHPSGRVLICLGPTATVMAVDLCQRGIQAVDVGHLGLFLRRHRAGLPLDRRPRPMFARTA